MAATVVIRPVGRDGLPRRCPADVYGERHAQCECNRGCRLQHPGKHHGLVEHCYQAALAIIEQNKPVVLALARALINHSERTLNSAETDQVIMQALVAEAAPVERAPGPLGKPSRKTRPVS